MEQALQAQQVIVAGGIARRDGVARGERGDGGEIGLQPLVDEGVALLGGLERPVGGALVLREIIADEAAREDLHLLVCVGVEQLVNLVLLLCLGDGSLARRGLLVGDEGDLAVDHVLRLPLLKSALGGGVGFLRRLECLFCVRNGVLVVEVILRVVRLRLGEGGLCLFNLTVFLGKVAVAGADERLLIGDLELAQRLARRLHLAAVAGFECEEHVADADVLSGLDEHGVDLAGLVQNHLVILLGADGAGAADLGDDGAAGDDLRRRFRKGAVHDRVGKEGQHQHDSQKNDGCVLDPASFFHFLFHSFFTPLCFLNVQFPRRDIPHRGGRSAATGTYRP